jgi:hypothetical protein
MDLFLRLNVSVTGGDHVVTSLVSSLVGLQRLELHDIFPDALLGILCRALTADSPLMELVLHGSGERGAGLPDLAALIAHNHSRLWTLSLCSCSLRSDGCDYPPSAAREC